MGSHSQWTNKYAILRDLSFAQGRKVPAKIVGSVGVGQKPPSIRIEEDTEEEFYENFVGDGNLHTKPDLSLIKHMINMVSDDIDEEENAETVVEISKLNPLSEEFVPKMANNKESTNKAIREHGDTNIELAAEVNDACKKREMKPRKNRRERNVALMSLLEKDQSFMGDPRGEDNKLTSTEQMFKQTNTASVNIPTLEVKLLKPKDFIKHTNLIDSVEKVNDWLQKPVEPQMLKMNSDGFWHKKQKLVSPEVEKLKPINLSPQNMFQKKKPATLNLESTCMFKRKSDTSSNKSSDSDTVTKQSDNVFVPSNHASEYYKKFVERHQIQVMAQEDIWKRAERLMKEIDAKRLKEQEQKNTRSLDTNVELYISLDDEDDAKNGAKTSLPLNIPGVNSRSVREAILLPQHRHELPEECKVCLALAKHNQKMESSK